MVTLTLAHVKMEFLSKDFKAATKKSKAKEKYSLFFFTRYIYMSSLTLISSFGLVL